MKNTIEEKINEENKKILMPVLCIIIFVFLLVIAGYSYWLEGKYNEVIIKLDNCTKTWHDSHQIVRVNHANIPFELPEINMSQTIK